MKSYQDYLIILSPPENIISYVKMLKEKSASIIGEFESKHSKAHLTLQAWPRKKPVWVEPLIPKLERDLQSLPPITLEINGFGFLISRSFKLSMLKLIPRPKPGYGLSC